MAESFGLSVGFMGGGDQRRGKIRPSHGTMSLEEFVNAAETLPISPEQRLELIGMARRSPSGSLRNLLKNHRLHLKKDTK